MSVCLLVCLWLALQTKHRRKFIFYISGSSATIEPDDTFGQNEPAESAHLMNFFFQFIIIFCYFFNVPMINCKPDLLYKLIK